jgi:hypothetical protein
MHLQQVAADERVTLTTPALCEGLRRSIPVISSPEPSRPWDVPVA